MATPPVQIQTNALAFQREDVSRSFFFATKNQADGSPLDVSSGYTAKLEYRTNPPAYSEAPTIITTGFTYSSTGVTYTPTSAQLTAMNRPNLNYELLLSNDTFATQTELAHGTATVAAGPSDTTPLLA